MRNFLATVLSVIAAGVMLIAYGLLEPARGRDGRVSVRRARCSSSDRGGRSTRSDAAPADRRTRVSDTPAACRRTTSVLR